MRDPGASGEPPTTGLAASGSDGSGHLYRFESGIPEVQTGYDRNQLAVGILGGDDGTCPAAGVPVTGALVSLEDANVSGNVTSCADTHTDTRRLQD